jgi:hypothetical protein
MRQHADGKIDLHKTIKACTAGMLTTRGPDGHLHSRAMAPCGRQFDSTVCFWNLPKHLFSRLCVADHALLPRQQCQPQVRRP